jgi:hypothetical protein
MSDIRMRKIRLYYDIVCPYSYMESRTVEAAEDAGRVEVEVAQVERDRLLVALNVSKNSECSPSWNGGT